MFFLRVKISHNVRKTNVFKIVYSEHLLFLHCAKLWQKTYVKKTKQNDRTQIKNKPNRIQNEPKMTQTGSKNEAKRPKADQIRTKNDPIRMKTEPKRPKQDQKQRTKMTQTR